jgi:putative hydrolase of the HAD superfamily
LKNYKHLFFDLDGTLWDLKGNTQDAFQILFDRFGDQLSGIDKKKFIQRYHIHNDRVWALYRDGKIEKEVLRYIRFERAFSDSGMAADADFIRLFSDAFLEICPRQPGVLDGAHDLLQYCTGKYTLHIITNGFIEVQGLKMDAARLNEYFTHVINSEHCGVRKPYPGIFEYALNITGAERDSSLMIGDDWDADVLGARDFGMDQVFLTATEDMMNEINGKYGHAPARHNYRPTYTIASLRELMHIL